MLYSKKSITATVFSLLLKRVSATTPDVYTHDATRTKASTLFSNSSMSTIQKTILPSSQRNLSTALSDGTSQAPVASANGLEFASSQSSASSNTSGTSSKSGSVQEYSFTYPGYVAGSYLQVSYKDTISASWISVPPEHSPNILIQCWDRNTTTSSTCMSSIFSLASQIYPLTIKSHNRPPKKAHHNDHPRNRSRHHELQLPSPSRRLQRLQPMPATSSRSQHYGTRWWGGYGE